MAIEGGQVECNKGISLGRYGDTQFGKVADKDCRTDCVRPDTRLNVPSGDAALHRLVLSIVDCDKGFACTNHTLRRNAHDRGEMVIKNEL